MRLATRCVIGAAAALSLLVGSAALPAAAQTSQSSSAQGQEDRAHGQAKKRTLRAAAPKGFYIGTAAAGGGHHLEQDYPDPFTYDREYRRILAREFNSVTPENQMKWDFIHPEPGVYNFGPTDAIVRFAQRNRQVVRGHTLLWHSQLPAWVTQGDHTDEELRAILKDHITTVVGRYRGRIQQWDVANEIFTDGPNPQLRQENPFIRRLGPGIIADAFRWAHQADPKAKLFLNDYAVEDINPKSTAYFRLAQQLLAQRVPLHGFAVQAHLSFEYPYPSTLRQNLQRFDDLGLETAVTELDVRMPVAEGGPTRQQLQQQADWYRWTLEACLAVDECNSFTIWGFTDKYSWVPHFFPGMGAANVMFEDYERKPAYYALRRTLAQADRRPVRAQIVTQTRAKGLVAALTFDDGPNPNDTPRLLEVLKENRVKAVFCLWGEYVRQYPQLVRDIAADGHILCNHTMYHDNLAEWTPEQIRADLQATNAAIREAVPRARIPYFRAPYGAWGAHSPRVAAELGMQALGWVVSIEDWETQDADVLAQRLEDRIRANPRAVVLLHDGPVMDRSGTVEAVARVVPELRADGWRFTLPARRG